MISTATVGRALQHGHLLIWPTVLLAGALASVAALVRPPTYQATALLSIDESQSSTQGFDSAMQADQFLAQRFIAMGTSRDVLQGVCAREGGGCDPTELGHQVSVGTPRATAQLEITASASTPAAAARLANETADVLIDRNRAQVNAQLGPRRTSLQAELQQLKDQISQTLQQTTAAEAAGRSDAAGLAQLGFLQTQYSATYQRLQDVDAETSQRGDVLTVEQRAVSPRSPVDPDPVRYVAVAAAGGLVAGLLAALVAEWLRKRIDHPAELAQAVGTDLVVDLSRDRGADHSRQYALLARMAKARPAGRPRALTLVASTGSDHVNDVAVEIARVATGGREPVLVVPAPEPGIVEWDELDGGRSTALVVEPEGGGARPPEEDIGVVIQCSPPPTEDPEMGRLDASSDRAVVVATRGRTRFGDARRTATLLRTFGVEIAAAVLLPAGREHASVPTSLRPVSRGRVSATEVATE